MKRDERNDVEKSEWFGEWAKKMDRWAHREKEKEIERNEQQLQTNAQKTLQVDGTLHKTQLNEIQRYHILLYIF